MNRVNKWGRVGVLMGGTAAEREISLTSGRAVYEALLRQKVDAIAIDIQDSVIETIKNAPIDRMFNIIHGRGGEDGVVQAVLDSLNIPYTGSGVLASALSMDKLRTKLCWQGAGLATPKWCLLQSKQDIARCMNELGFPVIVKPALEGSSLGMSRATTETELYRAWQLAAQFNCDVYAESWVQGSEYTVAILAEQALPVIRLATPNVFYDFDAKYQAKTTQYYCPAGLTDHQENKLAALALQACRVIGVVGWGRVDLFIDRDQQVQLIEVNTVPGMTDHSLVPMAAKQAGLDFDELVMRVLATSFNA